MSKEQVPALTRPENKGVIDRNNSSVKPYELDPELMQLKIVEMMMRKFPTPAIHDKKFSVRYGIFTAVNHRDPIYDEKKLGDAMTTINAKAFVAGMDRIKWMDENQLECTQLIEKALVTPGNETGYDSSLRLSVYENCDWHSVNDNGLLFHNFFAWANRPKYIIQGNAATMGMPQEEEKQSVIGRVIGWFRGGDKNNPQQQG